MSTSTSYSNLSSKTLHYIMKARKASTSPAILNRSTLSETCLPSNSPSPTLTLDLTAALNRIAELEDSASKSAKLLTLALDRIAKLEEQVTRCSTSTSTLHTPSTPNSLFTPSTPQLPAHLASPRRPRCGKGAACKFGHNTDFNTSDSEDGFAGRRLGPPPPRRSKRRPPPYRPRPQVKSSSVPYPPSTSSEPCSPVLLPRSVHDISPTGLQEEHVPTNTTASLLGHTNFTTEQLYCKLSTNTTYGNSYNYNHNKLPKLRVKKI